MEEEEVQCTNDMEELYLYDEHPAIPIGERWVPLGADNQDSELATCSHLDLGYLCEVEHLRHLEEEQEQLNSSLMALTTHFAQVQFRLKQIVDAPADEKEKLLKELEEFAFRGIPDMRDYHTVKEAEADIARNENGHDHEEKMLAQRVKQHELITQLKTQLEDLETYAYETGEAGLPQGVLVERQKVIIDQLKKKLNLNVDGMDLLSVDELRSQVDHAVSQLVNPLKMKDQLVSQLKTQITDLERFIEFLQGEEGSSGSMGRQRQCTCTCPLHGKPHGVKVGNQDLRNQRINSASDRGRRFKMKVEQDELRDKTINIMKRALTLLQIFTIAQFGCGSEHFHKNTLKKTSKGNHWGDLRAHLEVAVENVLQLASQQETPVDSDYTSDSEDSPVVLCNEKLTTAVRKELAVAIRDLMQHGLMHVGQSNSLVPFIGCLSTKTASTTPMMHAWDLVLKYYELKQGEQYNSTPARCLSQSFNLNIVGGTAITNKQTLLGSIGSVVASHLPYKRSPDSHFKAFICAALNAKKLVSWLRLIFRSQNLIEQYYQPWSYVTKTGFEDAFHSLEKLQVFNFDLPVDLAVKQFQNIKDAF